MNVLLMTNSKGYGAQNQLVTTQYSIVCYYGIDHVTHLMTDQQSDMWYLHNEHVSENFPIMLKIAFNHLTSLPALVCVLGHKAI